MKIADEFPQVLEYSFEQSKLRRYWKWRIIASLGSFAAFLGLYWVFVPLAWLSKGPVSPPNVAAFWWIAGALLVGPIANVLIATVVLMVVTARPIRWAVDHYTLRVEGAYLRLTSGYFVREDRRMHFKAVTDYSVEQGPLLWFCGLKALRLRMLGGRDLVIPGLVQPELVRDQLSKIDAARE